MLVTTSEYQSYRNVTTQRVYEQLDETSLGHKNLVMTDEDFVPRARLLDSASIVASQLACNQTALLGLVQCGLMLHFPRLTALAALARLKTAIATSLQL